MGTFDAWNNERTFFPFSFAYYYRPELFLKFFVPETDLHNCCSLELFSLLKTKIVSFIV